MTDEDYMELALKLARRGWGWTSPNPMVGAVIVKGDRTIGKGYHRRFGGDHAEIDAIKNATEPVAGATMYVTLEPCSHFGKTPPCVDVLIRSKLKRVVIGAQDPNPLVRGKSIEKLRAEGIEITVGVLEEQSRKLNEAHFKYMTTGTPLVTLKCAQTLDGRIATATGESKWITSERFQRFVHRLRAGNDAVMVGTGTVIRDDPQLTVRLFKGRSPLRVVLDSGLRIPLNARVLTDREAPTLIVSTPRADRDKLALVRRTGAEVLISDEDERGEIDLRHLLEALGRWGLSSILVEGGSQVITSFIRQKLADKLVIAIAPKLIGKGTDAVGELNTAELSRAIRLAFDSIRRVGEDLVIEAYFKSAE